MKEIKLTVYSASELDEHVKAQVINRYREINVDDSRWHEYEVDCAKEDLEEVGITIDEHMVFFDLHERTLLMENVQIDLDNSNLQKKLWKDPNWKRFLSAMAIEALVHAGKRVSDYIYCVNVEWQRYVLTVNFEYDEEGIINLFNSSSENLSPEEVSSLLENMEAYLVQYLEETAQNLLKQLDAAYDDLIRDESVVETLDANDFTFTKAGTLVKA
jgi:hypothetical protein